MRDLKVAVVGDTILDEYCYCSPLGISSKDPVLSVNYHRKDLFAGGSLAVANHVANFAGEVGLFTVIGEHNSHEEFIRKSLNPSIVPHFMVQDGAPTLMKRRYLEEYSLNKLLEVYVMDDTGLQEHKDRAFRELLEKELAGYNLVIAADFGHGAISQAMRETLVEHAPFLAVNTQANSGNRGYHSITRYKRADFVSIAEHEMRLEMRDKKGDVQPMLEELATRLASAQFVVTRGKRGCLIQDKELGLIEIPAFAMKIVDRIGAGDAFLSIAAMAACQKAPAECIGFIGNAVGALAVEILGNASAIDKHSLLRYMSTLLH